MRTGKCSDCQVPKQSVDVFDSLGRNVPKRGPTAPVKSLAAYAYVAAKEGSLQSGRKIYDYLNEEQTRLLPAVAFEAMSLDLLQLVGASVAVLREPSSVAEEEPSPVPMPIAGIGVGACGLPGTLIA